MEKYVYLFHEGNKDMRDLLGGKGANLAEMTNIGLSVPRGFTISTEACTKYYEDNKTINSDIESEIFEALKTLEETTGKKMGDNENPLLVSVRSGARISMPGMMDTVLNLGQNDEVAEILAKKFNNPRFAYDSYRRFIQMFSDVVMDFPKKNFEGHFDKFKEAKGVKYDTELTAEDLKKVVNEYKEIYKGLSGTDFPQDPKEQLLAAVKAVFRSWNNDRAIMYRRLNDIPGEWGTAVNVQEMVYGNMGETSGTGVAFTRNPSTGEKVLYGEYLINAQGEDVVAGIRTPQSIDKLKEDLPEVYEEFVKNANLLEEYYKDMQDMEFTIEEGKLFMLQTRNGKRTGAAAIKIAVDLVNEGFKTKEEVVAMVDPRTLDHLLHPTFEPNALKEAKEIATGLAASPGAAAGHIYFTAEEVVEAHKSGVKKTLLVRSETSPEDIEGMHTAEGILTTRGGMTSHAAVVARGMGTSCVCGCSSLVINEHSKTITTSDGKVYKEGDILSIDGSTGKIYGEEIPTVEPTISGDFDTFMKWADEFRTLKIRANADTPTDAKKAVELGAEGIGLCRTEHMFFEEARIFAFRKMILSDTVEEREEALKDILPLQRGDFEALFKELNPYAVTIRYLDPPFHEFLPHTKGEIETLANALEISYDELVERIDSLKEFNPMMGHRGCRLLISYPEICVMQTRAIIEAAINVKKAGLSVEPELMVPLIGHINEFKYLKKIIVETANSIIKDSGIELTYKVGTMIEIPRAALTADIIAKEAEFFSFGTNDLTQMTFGFSRDDAAKFLADYYEKGVFESDVFARIDEDGVGALMKIAAEKGRSTKPNIKLGICGEHGGEPSSIAFCNSLGFNYVSCSPFRVPIARLAAAQAALKNKN